jgi:hypothetical protein
LPRFLQDWTDWERKDKNILFILIRLNHSNPEAKILLNPDFCTAMPSLDGIYGY